MRSNPDFFQGKTASFNHRGGRPRSDKYIYSDYSGSGNLEVYFDRSNVDNEQSISQDRISRNIYDKQSVRPTHESPMNYQKNLTISFFEDDDDEGDIGQEDEEEFPKGLKVATTPRSPAGSSPAHAPNEGGDKDVSGILSLTSKNFKLNKLNRYGSGVVSPSLSSSPSQHRMSSLKLEKGRSTVSGFAGYASKQSMRPKMNLTALIAQARKLGLFKRTFAFEKYISKTQFNIIKDMSTGKFEKSEQKRFEQLDKLKEKVLFASRTKAKHHGGHHKRKSTLKWSRKHIPSLKSLYKRFTAFFKPVIMPNGKWRMFWDIFVMILIFYDLLLVPLQISFDLNSTKAMVYIELFFTICFLFDIFLNFDTGYYEKGLLVMERKKIAWHYIKSWFFIDAISSFPYTYVFDSFDDDNSYNNDGFQVGQVLKFLKLLRIIRVLRVLKLRVIFSKLESYIDFSPAVASITGFLKISLIILIIAHWLACIWHFVGTLELLEDPDNWITRNNMVDYYWTKRYIASLYWAVTTMITVGYGDITPTTSYERVLAIVTMLIASVVFAFTMNRINHILTGLDNTSETYKKALSMITDYMKKKHVKKELQIKIKKYLEYALSVDTSLDSNEAVLNTYLNSSLKDELISEIYGKIILANPVMKRFSNHFMAKASLIMREKIFSPEDTIFLEYKYKDTNIYFIASGKVEIFHFFSSSYLKTLTKDESFGEVSFFTGKPHSISARSVDFSSVYYVKREEFVILLEEFPSEKEKFYEVKDKIKNYKDFSFLGAKCFACDGTDHLVTSCPTVHLVIDKPKFCNSYIQRRNNFMSNFLRTGKRFTNDPNRYTDLYIAARRFQKKVSDGGYRYSRCRLIETIVDAAIPEQHSPKERRTSLMVRSFRESIRKSNREPTIDVIDAKGNPSAKSAINLGPEAAEEQQIQIHCEIPNTFMPQHLSLIFTPTKDDAKKGFFGSKETPWENDIDMIQNYMFYFPHNNFNTMHSMALYQPKTTMFEYPTGTQATTKSTLKKFLNIMRRRMTTKREEVLSKTLSMRTPDSTVSIEQNYNQKIRQPRRSRFYRDRQSSIFLTTGPLGDPDASADDEYENEM